MSRWWAFLWSPCWFGHAERVMELWPSLPGERDPHRYVLICPRCRDAHIVRVVPS